MLNQDLLNDPYVQVKLNELHQDDEHYYLYKHLGIDTEELVFNLFKKCHFKFSFPTNFNDPYDCCFNTNIDFSNLKREIFNKEYGLNIAKKDWKLKKNEYQYNLEQLMKKEAIKEFRTRFTVNCFNNSPLNILMWSHYAKNHEGFMVEFKFPKSQSGHIPLPVNYDHQYPTLNLPWSRKAFLATQDKYNEHFKKMFFLKSQDWSYENEYRLIGKTELSTFPPHYISSVILGTKTKDNDKLKIKKFVAEFNDKHNLNIQVFNASLSKDKYELRASNHPRLSKKN